MIGHRDLRGFLSMAVGTKTPPMPGHPDWTVTPPGAPTTLRSDSAASVLMKR